MRGRRGVAPALVVFGLVLVTGCGGNPVSFEPLHGTAGDLTAATATASVPSVAPSGTTPDETATESFPTPRSPMMSVIGDVQLEGAVTWSGTVHARCEGQGSNARSVIAEVPGHGRLTISAVPLGVTTVTLTQDNGTYTFSRLGAGGPVRVTADRTVVTGAVLVQGPAEVILMANFAC